MFLSLYLIAGSARYLHIASLIGLFIVLLYKASNLPSILLLFLTHKI